MEGNDIKKYLDSNGIKQSFLSEKTDMPASILNLMLNNNRKIEINEYIKICEVLELPLDYFAKKSHQMREEIER